MVTKHELQTGKPSGIDLALMAVGGPVRTRRSRLAKKVGVTRQTVFHWCKQGEIPVNRVKDVARVLNLPPHLLNSMFLSEKCPKARACLCFFFFPFSLVDPAGTVFVKLASERLKVPGLKRLADFLHEVEIVVQVVDGI